MAVDPSGQSTEESLQLTEFGGVNLTDARTRIEDKEFAWLEQAMPIGNGNLRIVPPAGNSVTVISGGISTMTGAQMQVSGGSTALLFTVNTDGSMSQVDPSTGSTTSMCSAGTVTTSARVAMWKDNPLLIADPTKGEFTWNGTTFAVLSSTILASDIAVFEGRVWSLTGTRTITFTAPNTFNDFTAANGAGTVTVADSAFPGSVTKLYSALEQLWIVGSGAVDAISNVQTAAGVTTFSITNIVATVGSTFPHSVSAFFRTLVFLTQYGVYAIVGATPQKLSAKLDGLWPNLELHPGDVTFGSAATGTIFDVFVWCVLVHYLDPTLGHRPLVLCFTEGKWFFVSPNMATSGLTYITPLIRSGLPEVWGTDGTRIFQLFPSSVGIPTGQAAYKIQSKLFDAGDATQPKEIVRFGLEFSAQNPVDATVTLETEAVQQQQLASVAPTSTIVFVGSGAITFVGTGAIVWIGAGLQLLRASTRGLLGRYFGMTLTGTSASFILSCINWLIKRGGRWN